MRYGKKDYVNYDLLDLQKLRETADDGSESQEKVQTKIDNHFFGNPGKKKTKKERRRERRRERQKFMKEEEDYV